MVQSRRWSVRRKSQQQSRAGCSSASVVRSPSACSPSMAGGSGEYQQLLAAAVQEVQANALAAEPAAGTLLAELAAAAGFNARIAVYGVGREGLAMRGLAMRLFHMGLQARGRWAVVHMPSMPCM